MKAVSVIWSFLAVACLVSLADPQTEGGPRDFELTCTAADITQTFWVADLKEHGKTNSYTFTNTVALKRFVADLPDRSKIWYGFEEVPKTVRAGKEQMDTHAFRAYCNFHGVILTWRVGF